MAGLGAAGPGSGPGSAAGLAGAAVGATATGSAGATGTSGAAGVGAAGLAAGGAVGAAAALAGAAFFAGAASDAFSTGFAPPNASRSRRATGASTVDDADLTNSPCSLSRASTSLLVTPSSFANSCTRALPATTSPSLEATAVGRPRLGFSYDALSSPGLHGVLMSFRYLFLLPSGRAPRNARPLRMCPVNRRCAALERKRAAGSLPQGTDQQGAARHPGPGGNRLRLRSRHNDRFPSTRPPLGAVRQPTLASDNRYTS